MNPLQSSYIYNQKPKDNKNKQKIVDENKINTIYDYTSKPKIRSNQLKNSKSFNSKDNLSFNNIKNTSKKNILIKTNVDYTQHMYSDIYGLERTNYNKNTINDSGSKSATKSHLTSKNNNMHFISFKNIQVDKLKIFNTLEESTH